MTNSLAEVRLHLRHGAYRLAETAVQRAADAGAAPAECHLLRGRVALERGQIDRALRDFEDAVAADPTDARARAWQVAALDRTWRDEEAVKAVETALGEFPDSVELLIAAGRLRAKRLDFRGALARLSDALRRRPESLDAQEWQAAALRWNNQYEQAIAAIGDALLARPEDQRLLAEQGSNHRAMGRHDEAVACYQEALAVDDHDRETLETLVGLLRDAGRWEEAEAHLESMMRRLPDEAWPQVTYADHLAASSRFSAAFTQYAEAELKEPGLLEAIVGAADMERELGRPDDALHRIRETLQASRVSCRRTLRISLARSLMCLQEFDQVLSVVGELLGDCPYDWQAVQLRIEALEALGRGTDAENVYRKFTTRFPDCLVLRSDWAWFHAEAGQPARAVQEFESIAARDPEHVNARCGRIRMLAYLGQAAEATRQAEEELLRRPQDAAPVMELAWIHADNGRTDEALELITRALHLEPRHRSAWNWRIFLLGQLGNWRAAESAAAEARRLMPDDNDLLFRHLELIERRGRARDVETLLHTCLQQRPGDIWLLLRLVDILNRRGRHGEALRIIGDLGARYDTALLAEWHGRVLWESRRFVEAETVITAAVERFGRQPPLLLELTSVLEWTGRRHEALELYAEILTGSPEDITARRWQIINLRRLDQLDDAEELARTSSLSRPHVTGYRAELAWTLDASGQHELARQEFEEAHALDPADVRLVIGAVQMLRRQHRLDEAEAQAREAMKRWPDADGLRMELGRVLDEQNRYEDALCEFDEVLRRDPFNVECAEARSAVLRSMRRFDDAERLIWELISTRPTRQPARTELGWIQRDTRQYQAAQQTFSRLLREAADAEELLSARCGLAWVALDQRQLHTAEQHFRAALQARPSSPDAKLGMAWVLVRRDSRDGDAEAERLCLEVLARQPFNHEAHTCLGVLNFQRGQLSVAGYHLRRAVEIDPYRGSHVDLGSYLAKLGRLDDAEFSLRRALELDPDDVQAHVELGGVLLQRAAEAEAGNSPHVHQAAYHFRQAGYCQPENGAASLGLALALTEGGPGGLVAAEAVLRQAIGLPECDMPRWHLRLALARLLLHQGDLTQRLEMYEEALDVAVESMREAPMDAEAYFVAGLAEFKLGEGENSLYLRPWRRHRARHYLGHCMRLDRAHIEAQRVKRALDRATRLARPAAMGGMVLGSLAIVMLAAVWIAFFAGNKNVDTTMIVVLTPLMVGLVALSIVLPSIVRLRLPGGVQADLSASLSQVSAGPTGDVSVGPGRLSIGPTQLGVSSGPVGRQPRRE